MSILKTLVCLVSDGTIWRWKELVLWEELVKDFMLGMIAMS